MLRKAIVVIGAGGAALAGIDLASGAVPADAVPTVRSNATVGINIGSAGQRDENITIRMEVDNGVVTYVVTSQRGLGILEGCTDAGIDAATGHASARCQRIDPRVTANMGIGTDQFRTTGAFTDPIQYVNTGGNDTFTGGSAADTYLGSNLGADTVNGGVGDDTLQTRGGNDTVRGGPGSDSIDGGDGTDTLNGDDGTDTVHGGPGDDDVRDAEPPNQIGSTDFLFGDDGNDTVTGLAGEDVLEGGAGDDQLNDGGVLAIEDTVRGGAGRDTLSVGSSGRDFTLGAPSTGQDGARLSGQNTIANGIEVFSGSNAGDVVLAGSVSITAAIDLRGNGGDDQLAGTNGRNVVTGGAGSDAITTLGGDDIVDAKGGETTATKDSVDCGGGTADLAVVDLTDAAPLNCDGNVDRSAIGERPHVVLGVAKALRVRGGLLQVPVACPKAVRHACDGTLQAGAADAVDYRIKAGRKAKVAVPLAGSPKRVQLRSVEPGDVKGEKTTLRSATVKR